MSRRAAQSVLGDDAITVGSFGFAESVLLAEIYSQALEAGGYRVERAFGLGPREFVGPALSTGLIELVPEYAGSALAFRSLRSSEPTADVIATHDGLAGRARRHRRHRAGRRHRRRTPTRSSSRAATARRHDLAELSDLAGVAGDLVFGGPPECELRPLCLLGLQERYGVRFRRGGHARQRWPGDARSACAPAAWTSRCCSRPIRRSTTTSNWRTIAACNRRRT